MDALMEMDSELAALYDTEGSSVIYPVNEYVCDIDTAMHADCIFTELTEAEGMTAGEMVYIYPPGIPYIVPGERISRECIRQLLDFSDRGYDIIGMADTDCRMIKVVRYDICDNG